MRLILLFIVFISCANPQEAIIYTPQEVITKDTLTNLINQERIRFSLNELKPEKQLIELSKAKAIQMEANQEINHNGFSSLPIQAQTYGQIVGFGYSSELNLFKAYINSPNHNKAVLGNFTHLGSYTFKRYNCVIFAKY